jgi:hypothetical protein
VDIQECVPRPIAVPTTNENKRAIGKDHNTGGRSNGMQGFFDRPCPPLWKCVAD